MSPTLDLLTILFCPRQLTVRCHASCPVIIMQHVSSQCHVVANVEVLACPSRTAIILTILSSCSACLLQVTPRPGPLCACLETQKEKWFCFELKAAASRCAAGLSILVHGGAGGVGHFALQVGRSSPLHGKHGHGGLQRCQRLAAGAGDNSLPDPGGYVVCRCQLCRLYGFSTIATTCRSDSLPLPLNM